MNELGGLLSSVMPQETPSLRCPKCGGHLVLTVTIHPQVRVKAEAFPLDGTVRLQATDYIVETKAKLREYVEAHVDERDEIYCENYDVRDGCDYWTRPVDLEIELGKRFRS